MAMRLFLVYVLVELAVVVALASTIGFGWTVLLLLGTFALGLALAGSQVKRQIRGCSRVWPSPQGAVTDGALVALGTVLTVVPGLVTSVLGSAAAAAADPRRRPPVVAALAARSLGRMPLIVTAHGARPATHRPQRRLHRRRGDRRRPTSSRRSLPEHPDVDLTTLLVNGRVHSPAMPDATAMAVSDGPTASSRGSAADDVGRAQFPDAEVVDLDGGFVAPAFVDSHVHVTATGLALVGLDLRAATSREHCLRLVADYARRHPDRADLGARLGRVPLAASATAPTTAELDAVLGDRPAYLARVDVHSAAASTALRTAGARAGGGGRATTTSGR